MIFVFINLFVLNQRLLPLSYCFLKINLFIFNQRIIPLSYCFFKNKSVYCESEDSSFIILFFF